MSETPAAPRAATVSVPGERQPTAVEQAAYAAQQAEDEQPMAEQAFFPTCMIWAMFIVLGVFMLAMLLWVLAAGLGGT